MTYTIKCDFCKKENEFTEDKIANNKKVKILYCSHCSRHSMEKKQKINGGN